MNEAASVFLRADIKRKDGYHLASWMQNRGVIRYLNEERNISEELISLIERTPEGMLSFHLNQIGRFFLICNKKGDSIGFIRLTPRSDKCCEVVYAIGEEVLWGRGYGKQALELALEKAFFEMRKETVVARINKNNTRSTRTAPHCGMKLTQESEHMQMYQISAREYFEHKKRNR